MEDLSKGDKKHRAAKSGAKADKKKLNDKKKRGIADVKDRTHNPRAFSVSNIIRTKRTTQRNLDRGQQKEVVSVELLLVIVCRVLCVLCVCSLYGTLALTATADVSVCLSICLPLFIWLCLCLHTLTLPPFPTISPTYHLPL